MMVAVLIAPKRLVRRRAEERRDGVQRGVRDLHHPRVQDQGGMEEGSGGGRRYRPLKSVQVRQALRTVGTYALRPFILR